MSEAEITKQIQELKTALAADGLDEQLKATLLDQMELLMNSLQFVQMMRDEEE